MNAIAPRIRLAVGLGSLWALATVGWILVVAVAPVVFMGWDASVLTSGSMEPGMRPGDLVVTEPVGPSDLAELSAGRVLTFNNPAGHGRVTHRVASINPDGTLVTKGDANPLSDSTPVTPNEVVGAGRLVVPFVGLPVVWIEAGDRHRALGAALGVAGLFVAAWWGFRRPRSTPGAPTVASAPHPSIRSPWLIPGSPVRRRLVRAAGSIAAASMIVVVGTAAAPAISDAAFIGATPNAGNSFVAQSSFCETPGTSTLTATADAWFAQDAATQNNGLATSLNVLSRSTNRNRRVVVAFTLPPLGRCAVTSARLRLNATASASGRTLQVLRAATPWTESTVTWTLQPTTSGSATAAASATGWVDWTVTAQVQTMYSSGNYGFLVRDATENGANVAQQYQSRESATNKPQLVLTLG